MPRRPVPSLIALALGLLAAYARAEPPQLPKNAITDDTFLVATARLSKTTPDALEAAMKASLGDKAAADAEEFLAHFKKYHEAATTAGADTATVALRVGPNAGPPLTVVYVHFKPGSDHAALENQVRDDEGDNNPNPTVITHDGDTMVLHKKDAAPPEAGSDERTTLFNEILAKSKSPITLAVSFPQSMIDAGQKELARGMPPALLTIITSAKSIRADLTLGDAPKAEVTFQAADEEGAKNVSDALSTISGLLASQVAQMKQLPPQALAQMPPNMGEMMDAMTALAETIKREPTGSTVVVPTDAKTLGGLLVATFAARHEAAAGAPANKGGL